MVAVPRYADTECCWRKKYSGVPSSAGPAKVLEGLGFAKAAIPSASVGMTPGLRWLGTLEMFVGMIRFCFLMGGPRGSSVAASGPTAVSGTLSSVFLFVGSAAP